MYKQKEEYDHQLDDPFYGAQYNMGLQYVCHIITVSKNVLIDD